ncbi:ABC transporter permease [Paenibacillus eucommiae]|uniref:Aldouronate transport system permease protein n=1 Tax=Paenibacillus eucommiae TaxID=1355755 RepID=A0ABS4IT06_9BACL|nr:ABC transporter permease subunit [Paenibacillus eucommiae]MBP1990166.1 putative aldouronate transport system permease protein [Paenibacillus eucommiae]
MQSHTVSQTNQTAIRSNRFVHFLKKNYSLYLMILPGVLIFFLFSYLPIFGLLMAFENYSPVRGFFGSEWVGLKHFIDFFKDPYLGRITKNTIAFGVWGLALFPFPVIFALLLNEVKNTRYKKIVQSISVFPFFISMVILVGLIRDLLDPTTGVVTLLSYFTGSEMTDLLADPSAYRSIFGISGLWNTIGFSSILYLAAIAGINQEMYESAVMDGAGRFKQMWYITVPSIMPTVTLLFIMQIGAFLSSANSTGSDFQRNLLMYNPLTYETADTVGTYVYRAGIEGVSASYSTAVNFVFSVVSTLLVLFANQVSKRLGKASLF